MPAPVDVCCYKPCVTSVPQPGVEPGRLAAADFESAVSAGSTTGAIHCQMNMSRAQVQSSHTKARCPIITGRCASILLPHSGHRLGFGAGLSFFSFSVFISRHTLPNRHTQAWADRIHQGHHRCVLPQHRSHRLSKPQGSIASTTGKRQGGHGRLSASTMPLSSSTPPPTSTHRQTA